MRFVIVISAFAAVVCSPLFAQPGAQLPPLVACGAPAGAGAEILCGVRSPEDAELAPDGKALVIPQMVRNAKLGLMLLDIATKKYTPLPVMNDPLKDWGDAAC